MALTVEECDTAIQQIKEGGQSFTLGDMTYSAANLGQLVDLRNTLIQEGQRTNGQRPVVRGFNLSGMGY